jgi:peptidyl-prolyl cis-trans isomerase B (cyclophilin B)
MSILLPRRSVRSSLSAAVAVLALVSLSACSDDGDTIVSDGGSSSSAATDDSSSSASPSEAASSESDAGGDGPSCTYTSDGQTPAKEAELPPETATVTGTVDATMDTSAGTITMALDGENAPCTVSSFVSLADQGYFDSTSCHRLTSGSGLSVLQCGDPSGTGRGGPGYSFPDELDGEETYPAGTLAMANAGPDTNGSQFFIVYADSQLPASYTVFGTVDADSIAVVQEVADAGTDNSNGEGDGAPNTPVEISSVKVDD